MMNKWFERIIFAIFLLMAIPFISIQIYRGVVNSEWYQIKQRQKAFEKIVQEIQEADSLILKMRVVQKDGATGELKYTTYDYEDMSSAIFQGMQCHDYSNLMEWTPYYHIVRECDEVEIYSNQGEYITHFSFTRDFVILWDNHIIDCPSLIKWYMGVAF